MDKKINEYFADNSCTKCVLTNDYIDNTNS